MMMVKKEEVRFNSTTEGFEKETDCFPITVCFVCTVLLYNAVPFAVIIIRWRKRQRLVPAL